MHELHPRRTLRTILAVLVALTVARAAAVADPHPPPAGGLPAEGGGHARRPAAIEWTPGDEDGPDFYAGTGTARHEVSGADFYDAVGRPDLAASFRRRKAGGTVALVVAGIALNAAVVIIALDCFDVELYGESQGNDCDNYDWATPVAGGLLLGGAGLGVLGLVLIGNRDPLGGVGKQQLAREHNLRLRHELGLPASAGADGPAGPPVSFGWAPFVIERGGGINLVARF